MKKLLYIPVNSKPEELSTNKFEKIMVEGVDEPGIGKEVAIKKAYREMDNLINKISRQLASSSR